MLLLILLPVVGGGLRWAWKGVTGLWQVDVVVDIDNDFFVVFGLLLSTASDGRDKVRQVCDKSETLELSVRAKPRRPTRQTEENNLCFLSFLFHA